MGEASPARQGGRRWTPSGNVLLALPALALIGAMVIVPMARIVAESLADGAAAYGAVLDSADFRASLRSTFEISTVTTVLCLVLAYPVAYLLTRLPKRRARLVLLSVLLCFWISILARTYAWTVILGASGPINDLLVSIGIVNEPMELIFNRLGVVVGMTHYLLPFMILTLYSGMTGIDRRLLSAARTLGSSRLRSFVSIFLPLSVPAIFAGCTMVFVLATGFYITPALLGGPNDATLAVYIERQLFYLDFGNASAAAVMMFGFVSVLYLIADRLVGLDRLFAFTRRS